MPFPPPLPLPFPPPLLALPLPFAMSLLRPLLFAFPVRFGVGSVFPLPPPGPGLPPGVAPFVTWLATGACQLQGQRRRVRRARTGPCATAAGTASPLGDAGSAGAISLSVGAGKVDGDESAEVVTTVMAVGADWADGVAAEAPTDMARSKPAAPGVAILEFVSAGAPGIKWSSAMSGDDGAGAVASSGSWVAMVSAPPTVSSRASAAAANSHPRGRV